MDLQKFNNKISKEESFALVRFGDGEEAIINNIPCNRKGFEFDPNKDQLFRQELIKSLEYKHENYFVGVNSARLKSRVNSKILSASIFVNKNYLDFLTTTLLLIKNKPIILVCNEKANLKQLPFLPEKIYKIKNNAWREIDCSLAILDYLNLAKNNKIILVAGGPYSCTLIYNIWQILEDHIFIDIGSTLDPFFYGLNTRKYHERLNKC